MNDVEQLNVLITKSDTKVINIAVKYGYDSAAAFTRAYKAMFGDTPTNLRNNKDLTVFSPIKFMVKVEEGVMSMNEKTIVHVEEHKNEKVICFKNGLFRCRGSRME